MKDSQFFTVIRKNVFFNSRLVQAPMVHEFWLGGNIKLQNSSIFDIVTVKLHSFLKVGDSG